jgi:putative transposase
MLDFCRKGAYSVNMMKAYKYRIYPNKEQIDMFNRTFGSVRFVYNWGLERKIKEYQINKKGISLFQLCSDIKDLKEQNPWLKEVNAQSLIMALRNLDNAFTSFFRKQNKFPRFKNKHTQQAFQNPQSCSVDFENNYLHIPKIKNIRTVFHREFPDYGKIKTVTIKRTKTDKYFVSILIDDGKELPKKLIPIEEKSIGVDLGLTHFAILSTGEKIDNPRFLRKSEEQLAKAQRSLSKKKKGSKNRLKSKKKVALLHEKVHNQRVDFLHKIAKRLIDDNQAVCLEDLSIKKMQKNKYLAKSISDASWRSFRFICEQKADISGKVVKIIGKFQPSSKMCNNCGKVCKSLPLYKREWTCECGTKHDRDILAANNILHFAFCTAGTAGYKPVERT